MAATQARTTPQTMAEVGSRIDSIRLEDGAGGSGEEGGSAICGVLYKYVNLGKGWRPRFFVLHDRILRYYKISGANLANVRRAIDGCKRRGAGLEIIGEETARYEEESRALLPPTPHNGAPAGAGDAVDLDQIDAQGLVHCEVASFRSSRSDIRKLYVHSGTKTLELRAETSSDRTQWLQALNGARDGDVSVLNTPRRVPAAAGGPLRPTSSILETSSFIRREADAVVRVLRGLDIPQQVGADVDAALRRIEARMMHHLESERDKRRQLLEYIKSLENDKQELERTLLSENRRASFVGATFKKAAPAGAAAAAAAADGGAKRPANLPPVATRGSDPFANGDGDATDAETVEEEDFSNDGQSSDEDDDFYDCERTSVSSFAALEGSASAAAPAAPAAAASEDLPGPKDLALEPVRQRRTALPPPQEKERKASLWSIIKDMVGKDLTRVCLPVYFNEPISALQKLCEVSPTSPTNPRTTSSHDCIPPSFLSFTLLLTMFLLAHDDRTLSTWSSWTGRRGPRLGRWRG